MKNASIMLLRVSVGILMVLWGIDKIINTAHAVQVSQKFYWDLFSNVAILKVFGILETVLGVMVVLGLMRKYLYPALILISGWGVIGCWKSIVDPWGWYLQGTSVVLYPTIIIFFACLVLYAFRTEDKIAMDKE